MTKHRSKAEWIEHIMQAASDEIEENGYSSFSMEAVIRRTVLSKGGVYRFFRNRRDLALQLFESLYDPWLNFDAEAAIQSNVSAKEAAFHVLHRFHTAPDNPESQRADRLWLRLIPEVLSDAQFREVHERQVQKIQDKFAALITGLAKREGAPIDDAFHAKLTEALEFGMGLMLGFTVQNAFGASQEMQIALTQKFIKGMLADMLPHCQ